MAIPVGTRVEGGTLITGEYGGTCLLIATYRDGLAVYQAQALVIVDGPIPVYPGPYTVTPLDTRQELETDGYRLTDDVTVNPIPYREVPNEYGGTSIVVG